MVAGIHRYSRANTYVLQAIARMRGDIDKFKKEQNNFYNEEARTDLIYRNTHRRIPQFSQSWVSTSIEAPILLLGAGLSKDELDLWTFFHRRARSTHYIQKQVPVWRFTHKNNEVSEEQHWNALTEGLNITNLQMGENWDEAWTLLLMLLEEENGIFQ